MAARRAGKRVARGADPLERVGQLRRGRRQVHGRGVATAGGEPLVDPPQEQARVVEDAPEPRRRIVIRRPARVLEQHLGIADDVVERRPQLVAEL